MTETDATERPNPNEPILEALAAKRRSGPS